MQDSNQKINLADQSNNRYVVLDGVGIHQYRSFGGTVGLLGPFSRVNLFIGQNNCGKSNVLKFLSEYLARYWAQIQNQHAPPGGHLLYGHPDWPEHLEQNERVISVDVGLRIGSRQYENMLSWTGLSSRSDLQGSLEKLFSSEWFMRGTPIAWFPYLNQNNRFSLDSGFLKSLLNEQTLSKQEWMNLSLAIGLGSQPIVDARFVESILAALSPARNTLPRVILIPSKRKISTMTTGADYFGGENLIQKLASIQHPDPAFREHRLMRRQFENLNAFIQDVLNRPGAKIEIPESKDKILLNMDGRVLPLSSLGTGVHDLVVIAAVASLLGNELVCLEEPETNLHPSLQRKLINYLSEYTTNQYMISTHSAHLLDLEGASVFHVTLNQDRDTEVQYVETDHSKHKICSNLGYRPADLLQSNSVIWVEGPSDRTYLKYWLSAKDSSLKEGLHYSIMFYGGSNLRHLSADDADLLDQRLGDVVSLRKLNRRTAILLDSDKHDSEAPITETKQRAIDEFSRDDGVAWITAGRTIENYISPDLISQAIDEVHSKTGSLGPQRDPFAKAFTRKSKSGGETEVNKVAVAGKVIELEKTPNFSILDLDLRVTELVKFVRAANDMPD